jgi:leucyl/phenylalanyl-tRNA---protein transferase
MTHQELTIQDVLNAYRNGLFPMADSAGEEAFYWYDPPMRGQLSIEKLHVPARLRRTVLQFPCEIRIDTAFAAVMDACAEETEGRQKTWINGGIKRLFIELHEAGHAHSIECWQGEELAGGLYGLAIGSVFCGESMFSRATDASKIALVHLCARLWKGGFGVLDTQYVNDHLLQFGVYEIPRDKYLIKLDNHGRDEADFGLKGVEERDLVKAYLDINKA